MNIEHDGKISETHISYVDSDRQWKYTKPLKVTNNSVLHVVRVPVIFNQSQIHMNRSKIKDFLLLEQNMKHFQHRILYNGQLLQVIEQEEKKLCICFDGLFSNMPT